jgi:hypothetical protein
MAQMLKKTAVIGLGGTGMNAVLHMKKKLLDRFGEIPPMIKFLVIDTTDKEQLETSTGVVSLDPGEFLKLEVRDPGTLMSTSREVKDWMPDNVPRFALHAGAKQVRPLGRLAVFANAGALENKVTGLISSVRDFTIGRSENYELFSNNMMVNVVCSLSGGTGSGCFLDLAVLTRKNLQSNDRLAGYFLLPDIFVGKPATDNVEPNAYGALKEINYFFENGKMKYQLGGSTRSADGQLFDAVYVVNKTNKQGVEFNNLSDLQEFLGTGILLQSSSTGKKAHDVIDNLEAALIGKKWFGKPTVFSSFGLSELVYPGDWYADLFTKKIALSTIQSAFIGKEELDVTEFTTDFTRRSGIREHQADDVIDALGNPRDVAAFPIPQEFRKETVPAALGRKEGYISDAQRSARDDALEKLSRLKTDKSNMLRAEIVTLTARAHGLEFTKSFLATLHGQLNDFKKEMNLERDTWESQRQDIASRYRGVEAEAETARNAIFSTKVKIEAALKKYKMLAEREAAAIVEIERREKAIDFFAHFISEVNTWQQKLGTLSSYCESLQESFSEEISRLQRSRRDLKPFVQELRPPNLTEEAPKVDAHDFLAWLQRADRTVIGLSDLRLNEFKAILMDYGFTNQRVQEIKNTKIDDLLKAMTPEARMKHVQMLDSMASPLWQYDQGRISADKRTENIYLFGVADKDATVFTEGDLGRSIESPYPPSIVSTGDPKRVICFKVEAAVPAFVISNVLRYRERYLDPNKPFSYHLHRDWEKELPDLMPAAEEEEGRKYWSVGLAEPFSRIVRRGEFYYVKSERKGERTKEYLVRLAQGRREAMRAFLGDAEIVAETREAVEKVNELQGNTQITQRLKEYGEDLENKAAKQTEDVRQQVEVELSDIEGYIKNLSNL